MKRILLLATILFSWNVSCFSQYIYGPCKDSLKVENPFFYCPDLFLPVCACDNNTYRSSCVAEDQNAISDNNWTVGPCTNLFYAIYPNQVYDYLNLRIAKKNAGFFTVTIYDYFGHIYFSQVFTYPNLSPGEYERKEIYVNGFEQGLYIIEVVSDGEQQIEKFFKVSFE